MTGDREILAYFLGIDAGGTKTRCVLADETKILARADGGSIKLMRVGEAEATARLQGLLHEVAATAGVEPAGGDAKLRRPWRIFDSGSAASGRTRR